MRTKLLILSLIFPLASFAAIYQSVDTDGTVNFSDTPQKGASTIALPEESYSSDVKPIVAKTILDNKDVTVENNTDYQYLRITHPNNEATLLNNTGEVKINVNLKPSLRKQDKLVVLLDNKIIESTEHGSTLAISNVDRGTHTLQVQVQDATGRVLLTSGAITFHMQRPMVREVKIKNAN